MLAAFVVQDVEQEIEPYRRGDGWVGYEQVNEGQRRELSQKIDALAEPLSPGSAAY